MIRGVPYDHQLEYIESTGTQWVDTGVFGKNSLKYEIRASAPTWSNNACLFGVGNAGGGSYAQRTMMYDNNLIVQRAEYGARGRIYVAWDSDFHTFYSSSTEVRIDGNTQTGTWNIPADTTDTFGLFCFHRTSTGATQNPHKVRISRAKLWYGDTLIQDLIPVSVNGVAKMYDRVTRTFPKHYGTFVAGPVASTPLMGVHMYQAVYTTANYIQDSPIVMWDGIENVGRGSHSTNPAGWQELIAGKANFPMPYRSKWTANSIHADDSVSQYISDNPGNYASFVAGVDSAYPAIVTARSNLVMTAEFVFKIDRFTATQATATDRRYFPFAPLSFLRYTESNYAPWGIGQDGQIILNPAMAWNHAAYAVRSNTGIVSPTGVIHAITFVMNGIDSSTGIFKGKIFYRGQDVTYAQPTSSATYSMFKHEDTTQPYTFRMNTSSTYGWSIVGDIYRMTLHSRAFSASEVAYNYAIDKSRFKIPNL